ncbi:hypothetical protein [Pseudomonas sp. GOM6]|nr:hypothetical protein [Pseudomonas sp. GOM6]MDG1581140.1 hypothetical protein [Pseudomonas sp. GOM6]
MLQGVQGLQDFGVVQGGALTLAHGLFRFELVTRVERIHENFLNSDEAT